MKKYLRHLKIIKTILYLIVLYLFDAYETIKQKIEKDHNLFVVMSILDFFIFLCQIS